MQVLEQAPIDSTNGITAGWRPQIDAYAVGCLLEQLDHSADIPDEFIARLEIPYIHIMDQWQRRPALHREILRHPSVFADFISWLFKRSDGQVDDEVDEETRRNRAEEAFTVLWGLRGLPGLDDASAVDSKILMRG